MKNLYLKLSKNAFIQGGVLLTASNFIVGAINYLFNVLAGRALGPAGYGEIVTLFSYVAIGSIPIGILGTLLIQKIGSAEDMKSYAYAAQEWTITKMKKWWFLFLIPLVATPWIPQLTNLSTVTGYALPLLLILGILNAFYSGALQALHFFFAYSVIMIITVILKLSGAGFAFLGWGGLDIVLVMIVLSACISLITSVVIFKKKVHKNTLKHAQITKRIRDLFLDRQLWYTAGVTGILSLVTNIDIIYVKLTFTAEEAGIFGAWTLFARILLYVLGPLLALSYIFFSNKKQEEKHHIVFIVSFILFAVIGFMANIGYGVFGQLMIKMLFGNQYLPLLPFMEWASLFGTGYVLMMFMMNYFLAKKSPVSLVPAMLFPIYLLALFFYPQGIGDVMMIDTFFTFACVTIFLIVFFKERFLYLIQLFRK